MPSSNRKEFNLGLAGLLLAGAAILVMVFIHLHDAQVRNAAPRLLAEARRSREAGKIDEAVRYYQHYIHDRPDDFDVLRELALLEAEQVKAKHYQTGNVAQAFARLTLAVKEMPDNVELLQALADMALETGRIAQASECYSRLVTALPKDADIKQKYARCLVATGDFRRAVEVLQEAITLAPTTIAAYAALAQVYRYHLSQPRQADLAIEKMMAANPKSSRARFERARYQWLIGSNPDAVEADLQAALAQTPDDPDVLFFAAEVAAKEKQFDHAQKVIDRARKLYPDDLRVDQAIIAMKVAQGKLEEAQSLVERLIQRQPDNALALYKLADLQLQRNDIAGVKSTIQQLIRARFNPRMIALLDAQRMMAEQKWREAADLLEKLRLGFQQMPEVEHRVDLFLGVCYENLGLPDLQKEAFERLLQTDPGALTARLGLASALNQTRQSDRALEEYSRLLMVMGIKSFGLYSNLRNHYYQLVAAHIAALPTYKQNWSELEKYVKELEQIPQIDPVDTALMRVDLLLRQDKAKEAEQVLTAAQKAFPKEVRLKNAAASMVAQSDPQRALKILLEGDLAKEDSVDIRLIQANLAPRLGPVLGTQLLARLEKDSKKFTEAQQCQLWRGLASNYFQLGDTEQSQQLWRRVAELDADDIKVRASLFELGQQLNDEGLMREALDSFAKALGPQSAEWLAYQAAYLVWQVRTQRADWQWLAVAQKYIKQAQKQRPNWEIVLGVEAQIAIMEGHFDEAISLFREADKISPLTPTALGLFIRLLCVVGRDNEARQVLDRLPFSQQPLSVKMLNAELDMRAGYPDNALRTAAKIGEKPTSAIDAI